MTPDSSKHHRIKLQTTKLPGNRQVAIAVMPSHFVVGDSISYSCALGSFRVEFVGRSPFDNPGPVVISDGKSLRLAHPGRFEARCFIVRDDGTTIGWTPDTPESGTNVDVKSK